MWKFTFGAVIAAVNAADQCVKPTSIPFGELRCGNNEGDTSMMNDGDLCLVACDDGAELKDGNGPLGKVNCVDGEIIEEGYCNCIECCEPIPVIDNTESITCTNNIPNMKKSQCKVTCDVGFSLVGQEDLKCNKNTLTWNSDWPVCEPDATTVPQTTTQITTTTTTTTTSTSTTTSTTSSTATTPFMTTTTVETTTQPIRPDPGRVGLRADVRSTDIDLSWSAQPTGSTQRCVYVDQFGTRKEIPIPNGAHAYTLSGLTPGFKYEISMIITEADGNTFSGSVTQTIASEITGAQCIVCHSSEGNELCNASGLSCEANPNQVCQTVVRASNGLPARFEKRCKQKLACENEKAMYKSSGQCGGGARARNVDVCVYCCQGDFCNSEGEFSDVH